MCLADGRQQMESLFSLQCLGEDELKVSLEITKTRTDNTDVGGK